MNPWIALAAAISLGAAHGHTAANPIVGGPAPAFELSDANGKSHRLADYAGKTVVLEWFNPECPFVKKHYGAGNMQQQQAAARAAGVVWLVVSSSAPGKQGHLDDDGARAIVQQWKAAPDAVLLDHDGALGRAYGAKTTPHMFVIDGQGQLRYNGAIDSNPSADPADIPDATQYVTAALEALRIGAVLEPALSQPYGCSVKY